MQGKTGQEFTLEVNYDSGCSTMAMMAVPLQELTSIAPPADLSNLRTNTASGKEQASYAYLEIRVLCREGENELIPWQTIRCHGYKKSTVTFSGAV